MHDGCGIVLVRGIAFCLLHALSRACRTCVACWLNAAAYFGPLAMSVVGVSVGAKVLACVTSLIHVSVLEPLEQGYIYRHVYRQALFFLWMHSAPGVVHAGLCMSIIFHRCSKLQLGEPGDRFGFAHRPLKKIRSEHVFGLEKRPCDFDPIIIVLDGLQKGDYGNRQHRCGEQQGLHAASICLLGPAATTRQR